MRCQANDAQNGDAQGGASSAGFGAIVAHLNYNSGY
jgi:hypothetical protein